MFVGSPTDSLIAFVKYLSRFNLSIDVDDWVRELNAINAYRIHPKVNFDLVLAVENTPPDYQKINMIQFFTKFQKEPSILVINSADISDMIYNFDVDQPYVEEALRRPITLACNEGSMYLRRNEEMPVDLHAKLIKVKVLIVLWKMIYDIENIANVLNRNEFFAPPPASKTGGNKSKKAKRGSDKKSKKGKGKKDKKGRSGKNNKAGPPPNPCVDILDKKRRSKIISTAAKQNITETNVFIVLIGFYIPELMHYLFLNGLPVVVLVKFVERPIHRSTISIKGFDYEENEYVPDKHETDLFNRKTSILNDFWQKTNDLFSEYRPFYLDNSFIMNYIPPDLIYEELQSSQMYMKVCESLFAHFFETLRRCKEFYKLHEIYLNHLKVYDLGYTSNMSTDDMPTYKIGMDSVPVDVANPFLVLDCLLDEVMAREEKAGLNEDQYKSRLKNASTLTRWYDLYPSSSSSSSLEVNCGKTGNLYSKKSLFYRDICNRSQNPNCHKDFKDNLQRLIKYQRSTCTEYCPKLKVSRNEFIPPVDVRPYIVHESNIIDMTLNYYKYMPECIREVWIKSFTRHPYVELCQDLPDLPEDESTRNRSQFIEWTNLLGMDSEELTNCILIMIYGKLVCDRESDPVMNDFFAEQYFCTNRIDRDMNYYPVGLISISKDVCDETETPNHYEKLIPTELKWSEELSPTVALQEFQIAFDEYLCVDRKAIGMFNAVLFRFHNDCNEFGLTEKKWNVTLRTPVTFRDFMHLIVFRDTAFILEHEDKYKALEDLYFELIDSEKLEKQFSSEAGELLFKESFKFKVQHPKKEEQIQVIGKKQKKGKKNKKSTSKKSKKGGKQSKGLKSKKPEGNPRVVVEAESFTTGVDFGELLKCKNIRKHVGQFTLPAVDFTEGLLNAGGCTTTFHSLDDITVSIDRCKIIDNPMNLSAKVKINGNVLIVHSNINEGFAFHVLTNSGGNIAFGEPLVIRPKKYVFYLIEEMYAKKMHCLGGSFPKTRELVMRSSNFFDAVKLKSLEQAEGVIRRQESFPGGKYKRRSRFSTRSISSRKTSWIKDTDNATRVTSFPKLQQDRSQLDIKTRSKLSIKTIDEPFSWQGFINDIVAVRPFLDNTTFKVISSRLHKYSYIRRKKSDIQIALNDVIRFVMQAIREKYKYIRIKKTFDIYTRNIHPKINQDLSIRATLPSGLHVKNILHGDGTYICQSYIDKGPANATIYDEEYRLFMRDGTVVVKTISGAFHAFRANGDIISYEIPSKNKVCRSFYLFRRKYDQKSELHNLILNTKRRMKRMNKHVIGSYNCLNSASRYQHRSEVKRFLCGRENAILLNDIKYTMIAYDGMKITYYNRKLKKEPGFKLNKEDQISEFQTVFKRGDGTVQILNKAGTLETTFIDSTRITSWCDCDAKTVYIDLLAKFGEQAVDPGEFTKINNYFQYEHLNYASVTIDTTSTDMKFTFPGSLELQISDEIYTIFVNHITLIKVNRNGIDMQGLPCEDCKKAPLCRVNIKPLYYKHCSGSEVFVKTLDTFNKLFIAYYDGSCKRNSDYNKEEVICGSTSHSRQPTQKVMLLYNNLRAKVLWSETMYANRMAESLASNNDQLVFYVNNRNLNVDTTELRIFEEEHYNNRFCTHYLPSMVINKDVHKKFDFANAAYVRHRILRSVSTSNLHYLLSLVTRNYELMQYDFVKSFDVGSFTQLCVPTASSIAIENYLETRTTKLHKRSNYNSKILMWKQTCDSLYKEIERAKDKNNLIPYFKRQEEETTTLRVYVQDRYGKIVATELHRERSGISNRSLTGSIFETTTKYTSTSDVPFDIFERIDFDDRLATKEHEIYENQKSFTIDVKRDPFSSNNRFDSVATFDNLIITSLDTNVNKVGGGPTRQMKTRIKDFASDVIPENTSKNAELVSLIGENKQNRNFLQSSVSMDTVEAVNREPTMHSPEPHKRRNITDRSRSSISIVETSSTQELQHLIRDIVCKGTVTKINIEELQQSSKSVSSADTTKPQPTPKPPAQKHKRRSAPAFSFCAKIETLFNLPHLDSNDKHDNDKKVNVELPKCSPTVKEVAPELENNRMSSIDDITDGKELGKDYVTSPSLEAVSSQMFKPEALQQFSNFEIQTLLEEAGITPLMYHETSELELVKQLMGLGGAHPDTRLSTIANGVGVPVYEGLICESEKNYEPDDDEEELLGSEEEVLSSYSFSTRHANEFKTIIGGQEHEETEEEVVEEDISTSTTSIPVPATLKPLHERAHCSDISIRPSVFDFPMHYQDDSEITRDASMIPLLNEKSLLLAIKKDIKKVVENVSVPNIITVANVNIDVSTSSSETAASIEKTDASTTSKTYSSTLASSTSSDTSCSSSESTTLIASIASDLLTISESPTPSSDSTVKISPSMKVLRDRSSFDARYCNVTVESIGVSTDKHISKLTETNLPYGQEYYQNI